MSKASILYLRQGASSVNSAACMDVLRTLPPILAEKYFQLRVFAEGQPMPTEIRGFPTLLVEYDGRQHTFGGAKCVETLQAMVDRLHQQQQHQQPTMRQPLPIAAPSQHALPPPPGQQQATYRQQAPTTLMPVGNMGGRGYHVVPLAVGKGADGQAVCRPAFEQTLIRNPNGGLLTETGAKGDLKSEVERYQSQVSQRT